MEGDGYFGQRINGVFDSKEEVGEGCGGDNSNVCYNQGFLDCFLESIFRRYRKKFFS